MGCLQVEELQAREMTLIIERIVRGSASLIVRRIPDYVLDEHGAARG